MNKQELDQDVFNEMKDVMGVSFPEMINFFIEDGHGYVSLIQQGIGERDWVKTYQAAHPLKSSSAGLGLLFLSNLSMQIETCARAAVGNDSSENDLERFSDEIDAAFKRSASLLHAHL